MSWQIAIFFTIIFASVKTSLYKNLINRFNPLVIFWYTNLLGTVLYSLIYIYRQGHLPPVYPEMMLLGVLFSVAFACYLFAARISLSQSVVFSSYNLIISMLLTAAFLGEWQLFSPVSFSGIKNIIGVILALLSIYLIMTKSSKKEMKFEKKWLILICVNILINGIGTFWSKSFLATHSPIESLLSQNIGAIPMIFGMNLIIRTKIKVPHKSYPLIILCTVIEVLNLIFFYVALKSGSAVIILPITYLSITILTVLSGFFFFKESHMFRREKLLGLIIGILGVGLLVI